MWLPVTPSGNRWSRMATSGLDRWSSKTELGLQTALTSINPDVSSGFCFTFVCISLATLADLWRRFFVMSDLFRN